MRPVRRGLPDKQRARKRRERHRNRKQRDPDSATVGQSPSPDSGGVPKSLAYELLMP